MRVASVRQRLLAVLVDAAVGILGMVVVLALGVGAALAYARVRGAGDEDEGDRDQSEDQEDLSPVGCRGDRDDSEDQDDQSRSIQDRIDHLLQSPVLRATLEGAGAGLAVAQRNWRSPGFRVVGLRRLDARTGGRISMRSALIGVLFGQLRQELSRLLFRSRAHRGRERVAELAPEVKEIERQYAADGHARQRAVREFYEAKGVSPLAGCGWQIAGALVAQLVDAASAIWGGRTAYDRFTGTIVVTDR